jgi:hypothetical protein
MDKITINNFEEYIPDDIVDYIYKKVVYNVSEDLLNQIKYRYKIKKFINIVKHIDMTDKYSLLYDILIVYYSLKNSENKQYVNYNSGLIPNPILNNLLQIIENAVNSEKKMKDICVKYLMEIPYCHIKYIFKRNRGQI